MKIFTYCILLFVVIGLIPVATAGHTFSGVQDETVETSFVFGSDVKDTVTNESSSSTVMSFVWFDPSDDLRLLSYTTIYTNIYPDYSNVVSNTNEEGTWSVNTIEADNYGLALSGVGYHSTGTFVIAAIPEFSFGSFISLAFAGVLYFLMRRTVKGSVNVG